ncbi:glycosyltransferase family A protein [Microbacterium terregens]|uniref:Glycosyltransferase family A protein n=1 Tax=Microbacterium terregens TaxID=69363 RepID=A0ABV5SZL1_9MICO
MPARVAIVIRTKNRGEFLRRALADVASQTFDDWEVIVVNDRGAREAVEDAVAVSGIGNKVTIIDTHPPGGRCAAANAGLRASDAALAVLHDDDDRWHPDFLQRAVAWLDEHPSDAGVMTATAIVYEERGADGWVETARVPYWEGLRAITYTDLLEINRAVPISFLYRRWLHDDVGFYDESLDAVEDWEFYLRVTLRHHIGFIGGEPLAYWTQRPAARGDDGNSMFALADQHERDDVAVRDEALRRWVEENGAGLPLYIGLVERRLREDMRTMFDDLLREQHRLHEARHPIWSRLRRLRHRLRNAPSRAGGAGEPS